MNKQTEALKMAYKAEETGNLQDLIDAVNMLVAVVEALEQEKTPEEVIKTIGITSRNYDEQTN